MTRIGMTALLGLASVGLGTNLAEAKVAPDVEQVKRHLTDLEAERGADIAAANYDGLAKLLADDYIHVLGNGVTMDKAAYIDSVKKIPRVPTRGPLTVRVYGDLAVITGDFFNRMQVPGEPERMVTAYVTQVLRRSGGQWKFALFQVSLKRGDPPPQPPQPSQPAEPMP